MSYQHYIKEKTEIVKPFVEHTVIMQSLIVEAMANTFKTDNVEVMQKILQLSNPVIALGNNGEKIYYRVEQDGAEPFKIALKEYGNELY